MNHKLWFPLLAVLVVGCGKGRSQEAPKPTALEALASVGASFYASHSAIATAPGHITVDATKKMVTGPATVYIIQGMKVVKTYTVPAGTTEDITVNVNKADTGGRPLHYGWFQNLTPNPEPTNWAHQVSCVMCSTGSGQLCCPRQP